MSTQPEQTTDVYEYEFKVAVFTKEPRDMGELIVKAMEAIQDGKSQIAASPTPNPPEATATPLGDWQEKIEAAAMQSLGNDAKTTYDDLGWMAKDLYLKFMDGAEWILSQLKSNRPNKNAPSLADNPQANTEQGNG